MFSRLMAFGRVSVCVLFVTGCASSGSSTPDATADAGTREEVPAAVASVEEVKTDYVLNQGDVISIQVFDEPDLTMEARVGASGIINYSYLGDVRVSGKSPQQLEQHIAGALRDGYLVNPAVNVTVLEYRPFYINGEVSAPGSYSYEPGLTLGKAITLAGGLTDRASTRKMYVIKGADNSQDRERISFSARIAPGDIISIEEGFF